MTAATEPAAPPAAPVPAGWEGILDPGERIVWQGRPDQRFHVEPGAIASAVFGLFFSGFALFWMVMASTAGGPFWMFGLIHFSVGFGIGWKSIFRPTRLRRHSWYTLTDRRAFIATDLPRKRKTLESYPITADARISFVEGPPDTIYFAREKRTGAKGRRYTVPVGFERIADGRQVLALLHAAQDRARQEEDAT